MLLSEIMEDILDQTTGNRRRFREKAYKYFKDGFTYVVFDPVYLDSIIDGAPIRHMDEYKIVAPYADFDLAVAAAGKVADRLVLDIRATRKSRGRLVFA